MSTTHHFANGFDSVERLIWLCRSVRDNFWSAIERLDNYPVVPVHVPLHLGPQTCASMSGTYARVLPAVEFVALARVRQPGASERIFPRLSGVSPRPK